MKNIRLFLVVISFVFFMISLKGQGTAFTYQGRLNDGAAPANGVYDLRFTVYDASSNGTIVGGPITSPTTSVSNGLFTVTLDPGTGVFNGGARWIGIEVRTNGAGSYVSLNPRQPINSAPYSITAANLTGAVSSSSLSGTYSSPVSMLNAGNIFSGAFIGNGSGLTSLSANQLTGIVPDANLPGNIARTNQVWTVGGNVGTSSSNNNFVGTVDNQALEFRVFNQRAMRFEPTTNGANVVGGAANNFVDPGIIGATISGGGALNYLGGPYSNHVGAIFGAIVGGRGNTVSADHAMIGGGYMNAIRPSGYDSVIVGGVSNLVGSDGQRAFIGGGAFNTNNEFYSVIGGGQNNYVQVYADHSIIGGGQNNNIGGTSGPAYHTISGGLGNVIFTNSSYATISGGQQNTIQSNAYTSVIGGGSQNTISNNSTATTIAGGSQNTAGPGTGITIGGGNGNFANASFCATVAGGRQNVAVGEDTTVAGGGFNVASNVLAATVGGGLGNKATGTNYATVAGGGLNQAGGDSATVGGGQSNGANGQYATVGGGFYNVANGNASTIAGGEGNHAFGDYSFAAGIGASATHTGSFVWSDASDFIGFGSTTNNQFNIRALGGVRIVTGGAGLTIDGVSHTQTLANDANHSNIVDVINGSPANYIASGIYGATIGGGGGVTYNGYTFGVSNVVYADFGTIGGGMGNIAGGQYSTVSGGWFNSAFANSATVGGGVSNTGRGAASTIAGGEGNQANGDFSAMTGGIGNYAYGYGSVLGGGFVNIVSNQYSVMGGGYQNLSQGDYSVLDGGYFNYNRGSFGFLGGGSRNTNSANYSTIPGGVSNMTFGVSSFAAGSQAQALHDGSFVWSDPQGTAFSSTGTNQFLVRAAGGVGINTNNPGTAALNVNGTVKATSFQGDGSQLNNINVGSLGNFVFAYTTAPQGPVAANTYQDIPLTTDAQISGWTHTSGNAQYTNNQTGIYMVYYQASAQATSTAGTNFTLHATLNSSEIPGSRVFINTTGTVEFNGSRSFIMSANAGDVLTLQFQASSTFARLIGTPSVSMTINRLQ